MRYLRAQACSQQEDHVRTEADGPGAPAAVRQLVSGRLHELLGLLDRQSLGRPALVTSGRPDQPCHVPAHQVVGFGMSDNSHEAVVHNLKPTETAPMYGSCPPRSK